MNRFWRDAGVLALVISGLSLIVSVAMSRVYEKLGFWPTAGGALLVVGLVFAISYAAFRCLHSAISDRLDILEETIRNVRAAFGNDWLVSRDELMRLESNTKASEIWIVSQGLQEETNDQTYLRVVRKNIGRGIRYTYIVPDNDVTRTKAAQIRSAHENNARVVFRFIREEYFDLVAAQDIAILGPVGKGAASMRAYMNLPIESGGADNFVVLSNDYAQRLVGRLLGGQPEAS